MALVIVMVGALFPAVGDSIGRLNLPVGVTQLLGGADYGTLAGWTRSEIGALYGPLVVAATAITSAVGSTAGEEQDGILGLTLAHPSERSAPGRRQGRRGRGRRVHVSDLTVLAAASIALTGVAVANLRRRDLRR
jgi:hypothetical protein